MHWNTKSNQNLFICKIAVIAPCKKRKEKKNIKEYGHQNKDENSKQKRHFFKQVFFFFWRNKIIVSCSLVIFILFFRDIIFIYF